MERIRKTSEFESVYQSGESYANRYYVIYMSKNDLGINRLGVSVSKKVGNSVVRHRIKRLVKESIRLHEEMFNSGLNIVVIARKDAAVSTYEETTKALLHLMKLHHAMKS